MTASAPDPARAEAASMAALIERAEADLAIAEEPSRFAAALESGALAGDPRDGRRA